MSAFKQYLNVKRKKEESELQFFRRRILQYVFLILFIVISIALIPSAVAAYFYNLDFVLYFDIIFYGLFVFLFLNKKLSESIRTIGLGILVYITALAMMVGIGQEGAGLIWLFSFPPMLAVLHGFRASVFGLFLNAFTVILFYLGLLLNLIPNLGLSPYEPTAFLATGANLIALNVLTTLPVSFLVKQLERAFNKQKRLISAYQNQADRLKKANESLDRYIYGLSHDIRGPVTNILGLSSLLRDAESLEEKEEYGRMIKDSANRLDQLLSSLIHFYQGRKLKRVIEPIMFADFVSKMLDNLSVSDNYQSTNIVFQFDRKSKLKSDKFRLGTVLYNLLSNALKFSQGQPNPEVVIEFQEYKSDVLIRITDNGPGIDEQHREKIFNLFHRAHGENIKGTGVGLYIAKMAVEDLEGQVDIKDSNIKGACFEIRLPKTITEKEIMA